MEFNHNSKSNKQSFKLIEIPLNKFNDEAIPHHKKLYESHKATVHKVKNRSFKANKIIFFFHFYFVPEVNSNKKHPATKP